MSSEEDKPLLELKSVGIHAAIKKIYVLYAILAVITASSVAFSIGLLVGKSVFTSTSSSQASWGASVVDGGTSVPVLSWIDDQLLTTNIRNNLQNLTVLPHIAGSPQNMKLAQDIYTQWVNYGFDDVQLVNYSVLLSYPNTSNPNVLLLKNATGDTIYSAHTAQETPLTPGENDSTVAMPFNAYSGSGSATGRLVYVNYATIDDFLYLTTNLSLNLTGRICIARYGAIYRGDKAHLAQTYGCSALIIYSDPKDYAPSGTLVYPNGPSLPPYGLQRGSLVGNEGDPLTNGVPSIDGVFRESYSSVMASGGVPSIPVQPIGYGDAIYFMSQLDTITAPGSWIGALDVAYHIWQSSDITNQTFIQVNNYQEQRTIYDVIGTIYGQVEPDQMVILGNHRDAWVFGAVDPNSGTAVLQEMARAFGTLRTKGWRPGRSIVLCSWDAEEPGLIGSTEWVEERQKVIGPNTVAYLNVDSAVAGSTLLSVAANPLLYKPLYTAAKLVCCNMIDNIGSGSDFTMFLQLLGISCASFAYVNTTSYAVYHSVHDNFYWMTNFGDPSFTHHQALGLMWFKTAILLATTPVLPYDPRDYAISLQNIFASFVQQYGAVLQNQNISVEYIADELEQFVTASVTFWNQLQTAASNTSISERALRILNNKLMNLERAFIIPEGLPGRQFKHVIFAPSSVNSYASATFPGLSDAIFSALHPTPSVPPDWDEVRRQSDAVRVHIRYATQVMTQPGLEYLI
eukprot:Em0009g733a